MKTNQFDIEDVKEKLHPQETPSTYYIIRETEPEDESIGYCNFACIDITFDAKTEGFWLIWNLSTFMTHQNLWKCLIFTEHSKAEEFCNILQSIKPVNEYTPVEISFHPALDKLVQIPVYVKELNQVIIGQTFVSRLYYLPDPERDAVAWLEALNEKSSSSEQSFIDDLDESYTALKNQDIPKFKTIDINSKKLYTLVIDEGYYDEIIYIYRYDYGSKAFEIDIVGRDEEITNIFFTFNEAHAAAEALRKQDKNLKIAISPLKNFTNELLEEKFVEVPCVIDYLNGKEIFTGYMPLNSLNEILPAQIKQFISDYPLVVDYSDEKMISIDDLDEDLEQEEINSLSFEERKYSAEMVQISKKKPSSWECQTFKVDLGSYIKDKHAFSAIWDYSRSFIDEREMLFLEPEKAEQIVKMYSAYTDDTIFVREETRRIHPHDMVKIMVVFPEINFTQYAWILKNDLMATLKDPCNDWFAERVVEELKDMISNIDSLNSTVSIDDLDEE